MRGTTSFRATLSVARKELLVSLRDRQTTIYTLVLPICMYPIVFWAMVQGVLLVQGKREHTEVRVGVAAERPAEVPDGLELALSYRTPEDTSVLWVEDDAESEETHVAVIGIEYLDGPMDAEGARAWLLGGDRDPLTGKDRERPDAVLFLPSSSLASSSAEPAQEPRAELYFDSTESRSGIARNRLAARLPDFVDGLRSRRARELGQDPRDLVPIEIENHDIAPARDEGALILSLILPMMLVIMAVLGAFFPAIDLTAGEKERHTVETTMLLPVPRSAVHHGKILAVCTTSVVATTLNLVAIALSAEHLLTTLEGTGSIQIDLPIMALVSIAPLAVLYAFFLSAALTGIAGLASTFKEGQALLGPVQMLFILPAMIGVMPGLELTPGLAFVPVVNVVLAFRSMLLGQGLILEYTLTAVALLLYAVLSIQLAVRLLSRENVALSKDTIPFKRLLRVLRSSGGAR